LDLAWRREVLKTSVWTLLSAAVTGREGFNGNRNHPNYLSTMEPGKGEIGAEILLRISREFGKSTKWLRRL
jgi:superoxide dismutase